MKVVLLVEAEQPMKGTNCGNCKFTKGSKSEDAKPDDLNKQGGTKPENDAQMKLAEKGDLITMPGKHSPKVKVWCKHTKIKQWVTEAMCCGYWDAPGTLRAYGKQELGQ